MYPGSGAPGGVPRRGNPNPVNVGVVGGGVPNGPQSVSGVGSMGRGDLRHQDLRDIRGNIGIPIGMGNNQNVGVQNPGPQQLAGGSASRVVEMLESAKNEFESVLQQLNIAKIENLELERKITAQVAEMDQIQQTIKALEQNQRRIRQQYDDDVLRLRRQLEGGKMMPPTQQQKRPRDDQNGSQSMPPLQVNTGPPMLPSRGPRGTSPVRVAPAPSMGRPAGLDDRDRSRSMQPQHQGPLDRSQERPMQPQSLAPLEGSLHTPTGRRGPMPGLSSRGNDQDGRSGEDLRDRQSREQLSDRDNQGRRMQIQGPPGSGGSNATSNNMGGEGSASSSPVLKKSKSTSGSSEIRSSKSGSSNGGPSSGQPSHGSALSGGASSGGSGQGLPLPSSSHKMHHLSKINSSENGSEALPSSSNSGPSTPPGSSSGVPTGASTPNVNGSSTSKQSKVKWALTYTNSNKGPGVADTERPVVEMFHTLDHQSVVCCVRFSADGTKLATGCHKTAQVFDVQTGARTFWVQRPAIKETAAPANEAEDAYVRAVCFSPDGTKLVAGMPQNTIRIWDMASNEEAPPLIGHDAEIYSLDYVGNHIVSGSGDRKVRLWDARTGQCQAVFGNESGGPSDGVTNVALSPDGRLLAAASLDKVVRIWDTQTTELMDRLEGHNDSVYSLAFSPDGKNIISGSLDKNIMLWDVSASGRTTARPRLLFQGHKDFVLSVAYTPDGRSTGRKRRMYTILPPTTSLSDVHQSQDQKNIEYSNMYPGSGAPGGVPRRGNPNPVNVGVVGGGVPNGPQSVSGVGSMGRGDLRHQDLRDIRGNIGIPIGMGNNQNVGVQNPGPQQLAGGSASRVVEMLESAKNEFESVLQQLNIAKIENLELERKITAQVAEMDQIQQTIKALEQNQRRIRQQYDDDVLRLRRQLEGGKMMPPTQQQKRPRDDQNGSQSMPPLQVNTGPPMLPSRGPRGTSPVRVAPAPSMGRPAGLDDRDRSRSMQPQHQGPLDRSQERPMQPQSLAPLEGSLHTPTGRRGPMPGLSSRGNDQDGRSGEDLRDRQSREQLSDRDNQGRRMQIQGPPGSGGSNATSNNMGGEGSASSSPVLKKSKSTSGSSEIRSSKSGSSNGGPSSGQPSHGSALSGGASSGGSGQGLPLPSSSHKMHHLSKINSSENGSEALPSSSNSGPSTPPGSSSGVPTGASTPNVNGSSTSKQSKVKWALTYTNSNKGPGVADTERPVVEMFHTLDHQSVVCCVRFSADGTKLATGCHKTAQVFDVQTGARTFWVQRPAIKETAAPANEAEDAYVRAVCFSPDGTKLVAGMPQNTIRIWDMASNEEAPPLIGHDAEIYSLDYVGNHIVSGSGDRKVRLWDARTGQCQAVFGNESGGPSDGVTNVALSPDGRLLAAASLDKVVRIWDTQTTELMDRLEGHNDSVYSLAFSPDGKNIISGSLDKNIMLWDVSASGRTTARPRLLFQGHKDFVLSVAYTPDGR
ncbi:hypothetical protein DYB32_000361 [Aphanomyces invadans]|uniref:Transcriptional repressor Tup1 N-terminal domain-containing protein n=1 Tax=Aphanomyces invadans TaxID=157072 RepID=A0A418BA83_9STRA|nr:hypothetical protein DYB32_000361 [Aphanomyces invadans]